MGDTKINLSSPEQLSWLIYSMKPKDKKEWAKIFNVGIDKSTGKNKRRPNYSRQQFRNLVSDNTEVIHRTVAEQCVHCKGKGVIKRIKKMVVHLKIILSVQSVMVKGISIHPWLR